MQLKGDVWFRGCTESRHLRICQTRGFIPVWQGKLWQASRSQGISRVTDAFTRCLLYQLVRVLLDSSVTVSLIQTVPAAFLVLVFLL